MSDKDADLFRKEMLMIVEHVTSKLASFDMHIDTMLSRVLTLSQSIEGQSLAAIQKAGALISSADQKAGVLISSAGVQRDSALVEVANLKSKLELELSKVNQRDIDLLNQQAKARTDAEEAQAIRQAAERMMNDADAYAKSVRTEADTESSRLVEQARNKLHEIDDAKVALRSEMASVAALKARLQKVIEQAA